jgi:hypothetical protein
MRIIIASVALVIAILVLETYAQDYTRLIFRDCGSKSTDIEKVDMTPMPLFNPGPAFFTFIATLKRPVSKSSIFFFHMKKNLNNVFYRFLL